MDRLCCYGDSPVRILSAVYMSGSSYLPNVLYPSVQSVIFFLFIYFYFTLGFQAGMENNSFLNVEVAAVRKERGAEKLRLARF